MPVLRTLRRKRPDFVSIALLSLFLPVRRFRGFHGSGVLSSQFCARNLSFVKLTAIVAHLTGKWSSALPMLSNNFKSSISITCFEISNNPQTHFREPIFYLPAIHVLEVCLLSVYASFIKSIYIDCNVTNLLG